MDFFRKMFCCCSTSEDDAQTPPTDDFPVAPLSSSTEAVAIALPHVPATPEGTMGGTELPDAHSESSTTDSDGCPRRGSFSFDFRLSLDEKAIRRGALHDPNLLEPIPKSPSESDRSPPPDFLASVPFNPSSNVSTETDPYSTESDEDSVRNPLSLSVQAVGGWEEGELSLRADSTANLFSRRLLMEWKDLKPP